MSRRKEQFANDEIYHVVIRRIEDNLLFQDTNDYYRSIFSVYEFNNAKSVEIRSRRQERARFKKAISNGGRASVKFTEARPPLLPLEEIDKRDRLVDILAFCFMPNHIHLLLRQLKDGGISKFMGKVGTGYSRYYKNKYELTRRGHFFQDRFTVIHIKTNEQLRVVFVYIHINPISLIEPRWKEVGIKNPEKAIAFIGDYKWSSYPDYIGKKNFSSVTEREFLLEVMGGEQGCREAVENWILHKGEIRKFSDLSLE